MGGIISIKLQQLLASIAAQAGDIALAYWQQGVEVEHKSDSSPVTIADRQTELFIADKLTKIPDEIPSFPSNIPIIGEESVANGTAPNLNQINGLFWLVDPIDGTKQFLADGKNFTINIALIDNGIPIIGAVHAPAYGEGFIGAQDQGAYKMRSNQPPIPIQTVALPNSGARVFVSSTTKRGSKGSHYLKRLKKRITVDTVTTISSSIKFCWIADGRGDFYLRLGPTNQWDTAAGHAILLHAGGAMRCLDGTDFRYGGSSLANPFFIAAGRPEFIDRFER